MKREIEKLIKELEKLHSSARMRADTIIEDGYKYSEVERAKSDGYAGGYSYCILRLKHILLSE